MAFDPSNDWTPFDNVESGENGTVEGLLPLEDTASAFRYRKVLRIDVISVDPSNPNITIKGNWKVRVRSDATRNADGSYAGTILFEQEMFWTALVQAFDIGGLVSVTWEPQGPSGSGEQRTSIVDGQACAIVENVYAPKPGELEAYSATGAWRFLNEVPVKPEEAPGDKYNAERGFVAPETFDPEGSLGIGGVSFFCEWQSAGYTFEIEEGAILETVFDHWQVGTLDDEALFRVSFKAGDSSAQALCDAWSGQTWSFAKSKGALLCTRTRTDTLGTGVQVAPKVAGFRAVQHGHTLLIALQSAADISVFTSLDDGRQWTGDLVTSGIKFLDSVGDEQGSELVVFGTATTSSPATTAVPSIAQGDLVRLVLTQSETGWQLKEKNKVSPVRESAPLPTKPKGRFSRQETAIVWLVPSTDTTQVWRSLDNGLSFDLVST